MNKFKKLLLATPVIREVALGVRHYQLSFVLYIRTLNYLKKIQSSKPKIFYLGIPVHSNLGDLAQGLCIRRWLEKHYSDRQIIEIETNALVNTPFSLLKKLASLYEKEDIIVFQSGYTTTDLGGYADEMHRAVMSVLPDAKMLMLPQTIFFVNTANKERTSKIYNSMSKMLFLARDRVSYGMAKEMFPNIPVLQFPDIVTTMIGKYTFNNERKGILFCCRDDGEKLYSDAEINALTIKCEALDCIYQTDTTKQGKKNDIVFNAEKYVMDEINLYSRYKVVITDRFHGTIFSLVAGTPVIIIKTTDHKVITGAEWFKGIYDDYVFVVEDLEEAYERVKILIKENRGHRLPPVFETQYYDRLPEIFEQEVRK